MNAERVRAYLLEHPCVDCGETEPLLLDFDHERDKVEDVATMVVMGLPWREIETEIAKCNVRCANCHRRKTAHDRGYYRAVMSRVGDVHRA